MLIYLDANRVYDAAGEFLKWDRAAGKVSEGLESRREGVKVYQLDICVAIGDHHLCPGFTMRRGIFTVSRSAVYAF
jgi:hypothetical protein